MHAGHAVDANTGNPTPQVTLRVCLRDENGDYKRTERIRAMPDSGPLISCVSKKWAKRHNLQITEDEENIIDLFNAEGRKISHRNHIDEGSTPKGIMGAMCGISLSRTGP